MEAHLSPTQPTQVNKITTSCEIYSGPHDTQYCMEDLKQAFVEYASSRIDEAGDVEEPLDLVDTSEESVYELVILSEDDYDRGCRKPSDLEDGFYKDIIKLELEYLIGMDDEGEFTKFLIKNKKEIFTDAGDGVRIYPDGVTFDKKKPGRS
nr:MAK10-like protein [Tanacetum cinerariifolium]